MAFDPRPLDARLSVAAQIDPSDCTAIAAAGYRSLVCNRPDGESPEQPRAAAVAAAAAAAGLEFRMVPVVGGAIDDGAVAAFRAALDALPGPVLAYCRSGTRSCMLWALACARGHDADAVLARARQAGYELAALRPRIQDLLARPAGD